MSDSVKTLVLASIVGAIAFQAGRLSAPPLIDHRVVLRLPRPNHTWIGFSHETRKAYFVNNENFLLIRALGYRCSRPDTNGVRMWDVHFEEETFDSRSNLVDQSRRLSLSGNLSRIAP